CHGGSCRVRRDRVARPDKKLRAAPWHAHRPDGSWRGAGHCMKCREACESLVLHLLESVAFAQDFRGKGEMKIDRLSSRPLSIRVGAASVHAVTRPTKAR